MERRPRDRRRTATDETCASLPWGADDFVSKPFRVPELLGRVRTQLRASGQLRAARAALRDAAAELERARGDAVNNRRLVDILHEVTGELSAAEIYRHPRAARGAALEISHCSVVLARAGDAIGHRRRGGGQTRRIHDVEIQPRPISGDRARRSSRTAPCSSHDATTHPLFAEHARTSGRASERSVDAAVGRGRCRSPSTAGDRACSFCGPIAASAA